jgi:predicted transcriptional regulator
MAERRSPGALEAAVMRVLWSQDQPLSAGGIRDRFRPEDGVPAITTVLTVLGRLHAKGRVRKQVSAEGGFVWAAAQSEASHAVEGMMTALLSAGDRNAALLQFAGSLDPREVEVLRRALGAGDGGAGAPG